MSKFRLGGKEVDIEPVSVEFNVKQTLESFLKQHNLRVAYKKDGHWFAGKNCSIDIEKNKDTLVLILNGNPIYCISWLSIEFPEGINVLINEDWESE